MSERFKRPEPERTGPVRNWSTVFGPVPLSPPTPHAAPYPGVGGGPPGAASAPRGAAPVDPVSRGVEAGYRVIDEYLRQGQAAARAVWSPFFPQAGAAPPREAREGERVNPWTGAAAPWGAAAPVPDELQQRMGSMLRVATDLAMMWMDFVGAGALVPPVARADSAQAPSAPPRQAVAGPFTAGTVSSAPVAQRAEPAPQAAPAPAPAPARDEDRTLITIEVASSRRVEVSVDLRPRSSGLSLVAHDLRPGTGDARIGGVRVEADAAQDHVTFRIAVSDDLPPGVYVGAIVDEASQIPRGALSVRVHPANRVAE